MNKISIAVAAALLGILWANRSFAQMPRAFVGLALADVPGVSGAAVGALAPDGPGARAGVLVRDVVIAINGQRVASAAELTDAVHALTPGDSARLSVIRGAQRLELTVVSAPAPITSGAPSSGASLLKQYSTFEDPLEHAFSIDAPSGWKSVGGLARHSALQFNAFLRSLSPDKMIYILIGEPTLLSFLPPTPWRNQLHDTEGTLFEAGLGGLSMVLRPLSGMEFAKIYGGGALSGLCAEFKISGTAQRADMAEVADRLIPSMAPSVSSGGEARFTCTHGKQPMQGRVEVVTRATRDNIMWNVVFLQGFLAPAASADRAEEVLTHMGASFKFNPVWLQKQSNLDGQAALALNRRMHEFFRQQQSVMQNLNAVDQSFSSMDEIVSGYSTYHDAATGNEYKLDNNSPYKWIDNSTGRIIATSSNAPPAFGGNLTPLARLAQ